MTESNQQEKQPKDATEATPVTALKDNADQSSSPQSKDENTSTSNILGSLALGLSAIAVATSGWLYFQSIQTTLPQDVQQLMAQQNTLSSKLSGNTLNQSQLSELIKKVSLSDQVIQSQKEQLITQQALQNEKLQSLQAKLNRLSNTTKEDWKLAEAEYLIRLANQRLLLEADSSGAVTLLSNADDILNELQDPIVFATRKALAKDIQALKSINQFDLEGAYLQLNTLYDSVESLPQREPSKEWQANTSKTLSENAEVENTSVNSFKSVLDSFWTSIRSLVVINYNHKPIKALLPPAEYQQLITGLQLQLEVAQVALIKGEPAIYQQALSRVANATTEHFETQSTTVTTFLASLTALQQLNPSPDLPSPRDSLLAVKSLTKEWNSRGAENTETINSADSTNSTSPQIESGDNA
ncbi:uroporphyrinogen-III C-methyltransferase [Marinomonas foliarum]|uniref:Uroporphyrinogen-III C-methyltransferase n=1 Tax=Marinomonas foliarum TaxID=491950 RepID=A0ABX7IRY1_9GAMM|nr:uroporphyrinogen-III C-methyltransferase [Marinomonas foliarum]QRV25015.1 uroporphyrinogen-III C-methyltransferase [Marinomonas foliarum]